jgi:Tfp pilus assembly protein PilX
MRKNNTHKGTFWQQTLGKKKQVSTRSPVFSVLSSETGMVLIVSLLLLLVATVVGITALSTSTTNIMIAGNQRLSALSFTCADSGISVSYPIIESTAYSGNVSSTYSSLVVSSDFADEIDGSLGTDYDCPTKTASCYSPSPDIQYTLGTETTEIDVDYLYATYKAGGAIEMLAGYEGIGKSSAGGGAVIYYRINSTCSDPATGAKAEVGACYRYISRQ